MKNIVVKLFILIFVTGCSQHVRPHKFNYIGSENYLSSNYDIGVSQKAYIGEPIVKVAEIIVSRVSSRYMKPSSDFDIKGGVVSITGSKDLHYPIRGETTLNGKSYTILNLPGNLSSGYGILVDREGSVHTKLINNDIIMVYTFKTNPEDLKFTKSNKEDLFYKKGDLNFELIYGGIKENYMDIIFREYGNMSDEIPVFTKNIKFDIGRKFIEFKGIQIKVEFTSNEMIQFKVISDSYGDKNRKYDKKDKTKSA